ncbi:MAG: UDP-N-acetylglucosamine 1-carboxyvinyltransferase, UDP-N-acetylglucosamine 1-carboxyvinyltransferase [Candidatus Adlerbacteria bacterium]|nr:UDP-N-acetylglucosamine 1-carboxyvinyltransferase, UDP-N-acetylglucosamine 1-carboxyvinyltransferase [Candidatus Adlerbacteria bacterium]
MKKSKFVVEGLAGQKKLAGRIRVGGAKNAVLKALAASVLFDDAVTLDNVPEIEDVARMKELLVAAGAQVEGNTVVPPSEWDPSLDQSIAGKLRASIVMTGPMLARMGRVCFPLPGGDVIGDRPIDLFVAGFRAMGATVEIDDHQYTVIAPEGGLQGADIFFPFVSVTATETLMMCAILAHGTTTLGNAAIEPEIIALAEYLASCGAKITGIGTPTLYIEGLGRGKLLHAEGQVFMTPPDRIETGSFVLFGALAGAEVVVEHCNPKHVEAFLQLMKQAGVDFTVGPDSITVRGKSTPYQAVSVRTHEYPGFATDTQAPMAVFLSQCDGESTILETIFDGRFRYADDLVRMGADILVMNPHKILIRGSRALVGRDMESLDIRAGLAYLLAATVAEGTSNIDNAYIIDRGYEHIEQRLQGLGLNIQRVEEE